MKKWLIERFLPMWAKETVLKENRYLQLELCRVRQENERLQAYIQGLREGVRVGKRKSTDCHGLQSKPRNDTGGSRE